MLSRIAKHTGLRPDDLEISVSLPNDLPLSSERRDSLPTPPTRASRSLAAAACQTDCNVSRYALQ